MGTEQNNNSGEFRPTWVLDKSLEQNGVLVNIRKSDHRRPRFSYEVRFKLDNGREVNHHSVRWDGQGKITIARLDQTIFELVAEAEDYIHGKIQAEEDAWVEAREKRDRDSANRDKPKKQGGTHNRSKPEGESDGSPS